MAQQDPNLYTGIFKLKYKHTLLRTELFLAGILTFLIGLYPLLSHMNNLPAALAFLPTEGTPYYSILIVLGAIILFTAYKSAKT